MICKRTTCRHEKSAHTRIEIARGSRRGKPTETKIPGCSICDCGCYSSLAVDRVGRFFGDRGYRSDDHRSLSTGPAAPIPMLLHCPKCAGQHVDRDEWATSAKAHKEHLCEHCGHVFRVANVPTIGVESLNEAGSRGGE